MNDRTHRNTFVKKRLAKSLAYLGNKCAECGSVDDLEFDHVNPKNKVIEVSSAIHRDYWSWTRLTVELDKCQLLCKKHHKEKSKAAYGAQPCGTYWKYRKYKCRCQPCVEANSAQLKSWKSKPSLP